MLGCFTSQAQHRNKLVTGPWKDDQDDSCIVLIMAADTSVVRINKERDAAKVSYPAYSTTLKDSTGEWRVAWMVFQQLAYRVMVIRGGWIRETHYYDSNWLPFSPSTYIWHTLYVKRINHD